MIVTVRTILRVGDSLRRRRITLSRYKQSVKESLAAQYPGVTGVTVTESRHAADEWSGEPYTALLAEGQWDDGRPEETA